MNKPLKTTHQLRCAVCSKVLGTIALRDDTPPEIVESEKKGYLCRGSCDGKGNANVGQ